MRFADAFALGNGHAARPSAADVDALLHPERPTRDGARLHRAPVAGLPSGAMVDLDGAPHLVVAGAVGAWSFDGYGARTTLAGSAAVSVITPPSIVAALRAGYEPRRHGTVVGR